MSWREKIKGGFEGFESIEHKSREVDNIKNNNTYKVSKGYLERYTQNPQNTQNPEKETKVASTAKDRAKKSFGDIEDIEQGVKNAELIKNNSKNGLKTTFTCYPHNPQNPQNPENGPGEMAKIKKETEPTPAAKIPAPEPPGLGSEYTRIWNQAWVLADWIDEPDGAPIEDRRARLPELMRMRDRLADLEQARGLVLDDPPPPCPAESKDNGTWTKWEPIEGRNPITQEQCPSRCKNSGKCYGQTYFTGKPGPYPGPECDQDTCRFKDQFEK